jgi:hypothetical protein
VQVERELARLKQQTKTYPRAFSELTAIRFYLHHALWECQQDWHNGHNGITNYAALLRELDRWRFETRDTICFVTFNYDTILEQAMELVLRVKFPKFPGLRFRQQLQVGKASRVDQLGP